MNGLSSQASAVDAIIVDHVGQSFKTGIALTDVSFSARPNQFVSIVGPSGCGKSTILRIVAGLLSATEGNVLVNGRKVTTPLSNAAMVFQRPALLPWRTTLQNVLFSSDMRGISSYEHKDRARELLKLAGLSNFENAYPHELSGGMQQRTSICRALLLNPDILLMDEPFGALDVMTRERMGFELEKIRSASCNTVLFVTHSVTEAVLLSDKIVIFTDRPGRVHSILAVDIPRPRPPEIMRESYFREMAATVQERIGANWND